MGGGGGGGRTRRLSGTKAPRCSAPPRVAAFEKKPDGVLMQRVNARTEPTRSFIHVLQLRPVWAPKKSTSSHRCPSIRRIKMPRRDMRKRERREAEC